MGKDDADSPLNIDNRLLEELGLGSLSAEHKNLLLKHIYEALELRVGKRLAELMTSQQLDEFEHFFSARDEKGAFRWLETNFPNYRDIVAAEYARLKARVGRSAADILAAANATPSDFSAFIATLFTKEEDEDSGEDEKTDDEDQGETNFDADSQ